jgi:microcystin-dependent protein
LAILVCVPAICVPTVCVPTKRQTIRVASNACHHPCRRESISQETENGRTSMGESYVGEIRMFGGNFAPNGWMLCQGQMLAISEYETLFNLIGTTYGGDGQSTFGLPDLQSRVPIHMGTGGGGTYIQGQPGGVESVTLILNQIPVHNHAVQVATAGGNQNVPAANSILSTEAESVANRAPVYLAYAATNQVQLAAQTVGSTGGNQPHSNIQPILAINFIISLYGIYPTQN